VALAGLPGKAILPLRITSGIWIQVAADHQGAKRMAFLQGSFGAVLFSLLMAAGVSPRASAWGNEGHQTVGAIADTLIAGTNAEVQVRTLLVAGESLSKVSIWADCAKGYCGPLTPEMLDFVHANPRHHSYHFTDIPFGVDRYVAGAVGTDPDDVVQILRQAINVLRGRTDAASNPHGFTKRQALLLLVHMVGDIHQPLHVGTAYVNDSDEFAVPRSQSDIDSGAIQATHGDNYLLLGSRVFHSYWDGELVKRGMHRAHVTAPAEYAVFLLRKYPAPAAGEGDLATWPAQWADESLQLANQVHRSLVLGDREEAQDRSDAPHFQWAVTVTREETVRWNGEAEQQLTRAGRRLANVLIVIWP
jgi:hypothetical protein